MKNDVVEISINCAHCDDEFTTYYSDILGISDFCCSIFCYEDYYSKEEQRNRKLKHILNEV